MITTILSLSMIKTGNANKDVPWEIKIGNVASAGAPLAASVAAILFAIRAKMLNSRQDMNSHFITAARNVFNAKADKKGTI